MQEILFSGKSKENEEWVISDCIYQCDGVIILYDKQDGWIEVIPETVGRFTGLPDKNGKKIFEGDIVKIHRKYLNAGYEEDCLYRVYWHKYWNDWALKNIKSTQSCYLEDAKEGKVIGNIHDNPEFLEV